MPPPVIIPPDDIPTQPVLDLAAIRKLNRQRFEFEQLTAITLLDEPGKRIAGYRDHGPDSFWIRGHMPGIPLLPGVLMVESAAQLCSAYVAHFGILKPNHFLAFGGIDKATFRGSVAPGARLWLAASTERHNPQRMVFQSQGFVDGKMVFAATILGLALPIDPAVREKANA